MTLWTASDAASATSGHATSDWVATGVSIDTRTLRPGDLFVALTVARDGHDFVAQALEKGASAALVSHIPSGLDDTAPLLIVEDVQAALEALGRAGRARSRAQVLAITGSVGKTSAKEMARTVLASQGATHAAEASYNNHWGVPLTLARMPVDTDYAVIEIGMNHPGEIAPLAAMARPHVAMITTIAAAHLAAFDDLSGIALEKAAIFSGLEPGGTCLFNGDLDAALDRVISDAARAQGGPCIRFGHAASLPYALSDVRLAEGRTVARAQTPSGALLFKLESAGRHFAMNALGVLAAAITMGADPAQSALALSRWQPPAGRGTRETIVLDPAVPDEAFSLLDDAFNANPTSLAAALEVLASYTPVHNVGRIVTGRRVAILGDMLELGPDEMAMHAGMADNPFMQSVDLVHCCGPRMRALYDALPDEKRGLWAETAETLCATPSQLVDAGDIVLVKGSKGARVSLVVDALRKLGHPETR